MLTSCFWTFFMLGTSLATDGGYTPWIDSKCSVSCGGGIKTRTRTCTNPPPSNGGKDCIELGPASMTLKCNQCPCELSLDVAILADISRSMKKEHLSMLKRFLNDLVDNLGVSSKTQHCALITFAGHATLHNFFNNTFYHNAEDFKTLVNQSIPNKIPKTAKWGTRIDLAYNLALTKLFTLSGGDRPNAENILIFFTDGAQFFGKWDLTPEIPFSKTTSALEAKGVSITVAGIGPKPKTLEDEMNKMKGEKGQLFLIADFDVLPQYFKKILKAACGNKAPLPCSSPVDVAFIIDSSGSIGKRNYVQQKDFVKQVAKSLGVAQGQSRGAIVLFSDSASVKARFGEYATAEEFEKAVDDLPHEKGFTRIDKALEVAGTDVFPGARSGLPKIAILITDGKQTKAADAKGLKEASEPLRKAGVRVLAVGVGSDVDLDELGLITETDEDVVLAMDYQDLLLQLAYLISRACKLAK